MEELYTFLKKNNGGYGAYLKAKTAFAREKKFLENVYIQLTPLCNLSCKMCYARIDKKELINNGDTIMRFEDWRIYIDSIAKMSTPNVTFTGGECTIHPDFEKIYSYAYEQGLSIKVMTNATYITDRILELWKKMPPAIVSITVYGKSPDVYESLCNNKAACLQVYRNIDILIKANINLRLKYTIVKENIEELEETYNYFLAKGYTLSYDETLISFGECSDDTVNQESVDSNKLDAIKLKLENVEQLLSAQDALEKREKWIQRSIKRLKNQEIVEKGMLCSACRNVCHITWKGFVTPCVTLQDYILDPRSIGFEECWNRLKAWGDEVPQLVECQNCLFYEKCTSCVAMHYNDTHEFGKPSPRLCWKCKHPEEAANIQQEIEQRGLYSFSKGL